MQISVILPVYNAQEFIIEAISSILEQSHSEFELIILDDKSTDDTVEIIKNNFNDSRIILELSSLNLGQANQMNRGIQLAKYDYIAIAHADDINDKNRFEKQVEYFDKHPQIGILGTSIDYLVNEECKGEWLLNQDYEICQLQLISHVCVAHPTVMFNMKVIDKTDLFYKQEMVPAEDYDLWCRLSGKYLFSNLKEKLVFYRIHESQISQTNFLKLKQKLFLIRKELFEQYYPEVNFKRIRPILIENSDLDSNLKKIKYYFSVKYLKRTLSKKTTLNKYKTKQILDELIEQKLNIRKSWFSCLFFISKIRKYLSKTKKRFLNVYSSNSKIFAGQNLKYIFSLTNEIYGSNVKIFGKALVLNGEITIGANGNHHLFDEKVTIIENYGVFVIIGNCDFGKGTKIFVQKNAKLEIGDRSFVTGDSQIICHNEIKIGENCAISWGVLIIDHDYHTIKGKEVNLPINIGNNVWICANVTILKGVTIPDNCIIAANSVVTNSFDEKNILIAGNPAKIIKRNVDWER
jgi:glycosyltransferase involved in cell wall biosynthesis/acetyltransferase-like isoleucine patch superfamily enzyme